MMSKLVRIGLLYVFVGFLCACNALTDAELDEGAMRPSDIAPLLADHYFKPVTDIPTIEDIFSLSPQVTDEIKQRFKRDTRFRHNNIEAHEWLASYINAHAAPQASSGFMYQDNLTLTASDAYLQQAGNCVSLAVMTASLARALNIDFEFQEVGMTPTWDRQQGFYLIGGHINVRLLAPQRANTLYFYAKNVMVDFVNEDALDHSKIKKISQKTVVSMFYNNMAVTALMKGELNHAYAFVKAALRSSYFLPALNNLAVIYRRSGDEVRSEQVYLYVLSLDKNNMTSLYNYSLLLERQGRLRKMEQINKMIEAEKKVENPYYYYDMAQSAFDLGWYDKSLKLYQQALATASYRHEFFAGLSKVYFAIGDRVRAKANIRKAISLSGGHAIKEHYLSILDELNRH